MKKNIKKITTALCTATLLSISGLGTEARQRETSGNYPSHNLVWESKLYRGIEFLSDSLCQGRGTGTGGSTEAAAWVIRSFRKAGLMPLDGTYAKHFYAGHGKVGHNIVGMIPGSRKAPRDSYIIVASHYDHLGILDGRMYPGADENASGTVAVTTLADMFSGMKILGRTFGKNILFVLFDGRQMNLAGSESLWRMIENGEMHDPLTGKEITVDKIDLMVNIEQIGSSLSPLGSGRKDYVIMLGRDSLPREKRGYLTGCNLMDDTGLEISYDYYGSKTFTDIFYRISDQKAFIDHGIPSVVFTSGITMNTNRTCDTPETLDMGVLRRRIILIFHWIERMAGI